MSEQQDHKKSLHYLIRTLTPSVRILKDDIAHKGHSSIALWLNTIFQKQLSGSSRIKGQVIALKGFKLYSPIYYCNVVNWKLDKFHVIDEKHRVVGQSTIAFSQESCFATNCLLWRFSCLFSTSIFFSYKGQDHWGPLRKRLKNWRKIKLAMRGNEQMMLQDEIAAFRAEVENSCYFA